MTFFNTIGSSGNQLDLYVVKAKTQDERILAIMQQRGYPMTPPDVQEVYNRIFDPAPLTSIRRAMSNLTDQGHLVKTEFMKAGMYGKPNYKWRVK